MAGPIIDRKSAPDGEDLKLELNVAEAMREYESFQWRLNNIKPGHPDYEPEDYFHGAEWFRRYIELGLRFVPGALIRLQRLRNHNLLLRQVLFSVKKQLQLQMYTTPPETTREAVIESRNESAAQMIARVLEVEAPL